MTWLARFSTKIQQTLVIFDFLDSLEMVIANIQKIDNKFYALNSCISQNLASNINSSQVLPRLKPTHSVFTPSNIFFYFSNAILAIN